MSDIVKTLLEKGSVTFTFLSKRYYLTFDFSTNELVLKRGGMKLASPRETGSKE